MIGRGLSIAGRKKQHPTDLYQTPTWATEALLTVETFEGEIWEPCSGYGAISKVLEARGHIVLSSDIMEDGYGAGGVDFLDPASWRRVDNIITNPPYRDALPMVQQALTCVESKAAFLLKLTFLESQRRQPLFRESPPSRVWVFADRLTMWPYNEDTPLNGGTITYAWFVWDRSVEREDAGRLGWVTKP